MLTNLSRKQLVVSLWFVALIAVVTLSVALGARWSTTALLVVVAAAPMVVAFFLGFGGAQSQTVHELLYAMDTRKERRS